MNILIQDRQNYSEDCIALRLPRRTQIFDIYLANESSGLVFFTRDLGHIFGSKVGNKFVVTLREKGHQNSEFAYHHQKMYTNLIEYNIVVDTKAALLSLYFKTQTGDLISTEQ